MLACALGAFIGALSALEIQSRFVLGLYLWPFGALFGGIVAYFAGEFGQLRDGIVRSYRVSADNISCAYGAIEKWKPDKLYWKMVAAVMIGLLICALSSFLLICILVSVGDKQIFRQPILALGASLVCVMAVGSVFLCSILTILAPALLQLAQIGEYERLTKDGWKLFKFGNPIVLPFFISYCIAKYFRRNAGHFILVMLFVSIEAMQFVVRTFVYVHSERRRLRLVDATLGAAIGGFFFGSAILGAIIGGALGGINYELVSVRWLKLVPSTRTK
ncbi:MAG: hypothetical protein NTY93_00800 [Candidatus Kaiserbacteria bacterium]|nr:hypothetical protein [Candidatus Kaiserbacteria bacterium]